MRILFALPMLLLGACDVSTDGGNDQVTIQYDENAARAAGDTAQNIGGAIVNDVQDTAGKVQNKVGDVDVDVDVNRNEPANAQ